MLAGGTHEGNRNHWRDPGDTWPGGFGNSGIYHFAYQECATLGDLKVQATEQTPHSIPPLLSGGVMILGVVLVGAGLYKNR
jgi:hypothetical protein